MPATNYKYSFRANLGRHRHWLRTSFMFFDVWIKYFYNAKILICLLIIHSTTFMMLCINDINMQEVRQNEVIMK